MAVAFEVAAPQVALIPWEIGAEPQPYPLDDYVGQSLSLAQMPANIFDPDAGADDAPILLLALLDRISSQWRLLSLAPEEPEQIDEASFGVLPKQLAKIHLIPRLQGSVGLPRRCRSCWIGVSYESGELDLWLSTKAERMPSSDPRILADFVGCLRQPYARIDRSAGGLRGLATCLTRAPEPVMSPAVGEIRTDSRIAVLMATEEGPLRFLDLESGMIRFQYDVANWMLDNLGSLRRRDLLAVGDFEVELLSYPESILDTGEPEDEEPAHPPLGATIAISRARDPRDPASAILCNDRKWKARGDLHLTCQKVVLRRSGFDWKPQRIDLDESAEGSILPSRGLNSGVGAFRTFSTESTDWLNALPLVGGLPVYVYDIDSLRFENEFDFSQTHQHCRIQRIILKAVLLNPHDLDGLETADADLHGGHAPWPVQKGLDCGSVVNIDGGWTAYGYL